MSFQYHYQTYSLVIVKFCILYDDLVLVIVVCDSWNLLFFLSKKGSLSHPLVIKPELSPEEDSDLMEERWRLIQSGIPRGEN